MAVNPVIASIVYSGGAKPLANLARRGARNINTIPQKVLRVN